MSVYVISTMTDSVGYTFFRNVGDLPVPHKKIVIRGGADLPSHKSGFGEMRHNEEGQPLWTAEGVCTPVSDSDYEVLKDHWLFKKHVDGGKLKVVSRDIHDDYKAVKKEVKSMETGWESDKAKQLTPETVKQRVGNKHLKIHEMSEGGSELRI